MDGWGKTPYSRIGEIADVENRNRPYRFNRKDQIRNVVATDKGYVRRRNYTDAHGNERTKEEVIIPSNEIEEALGPATVVDMYGDRPSSTEAELFLVFSEPVFVTGTTTNDYISVDAEVSNGEIFALTSLHDDHPRIVGANNTIRFYIDSPQTHPCLLYTSPSPRDRQKSRMPSSA